MTMDTTPDANPYAPPEAALADPAAMTGDGTLPLAGRGARLGAIVIDSLIQMAALVPLLFLWFTSWTEYATAMGSAFSLVKVAYIVLASVVYFAINGWMLHKSGQSIGKRLVGIRIVSQSGQLVPLGELVIKRWIPMAVIPQIPLVGLLFALVDCLMIFRASRRCLHDVFAGTIVVDASYDPTRIAST